MVNKYDVSKSLNSYNYSYDRHRMLISSAICYLLPHLYDWL